MVFYKHISCFYLYILIVIAYHSYLTESKIEYKPGESLTISDLNITSIEAESFKQFSNIKKLYIVNTQLKDFPCGIAHLNKLKAIYYISNVQTNNVNELMNLPQKLKNNIKVISLKNNNLKTIPVKISTFLNVKTMHLNGNNLQVIPDSISNLNNLESLALSYNLLDKLPNDFYKLIKLKKLECIHNRLTDIDFSFHKLKNLSFLCLENNLFNKIPTCLYILPNLVQLYMGNNRITSLFPNEIEIKDLEINVSAQRNQQLKLFPVLYELSCCSNLLTEISYEIKQFFSIRNLYLSSNLISNISPEIFMLPNIKILNLDYNLLEYIPLFTGNRNTKRIKLKLNNNVIKNDNSVNQGLGIEGIRTMFKNVNINQQYANFYTYEQAIDLYYKNNPHWIIEKLNKIKVNDDLVDKTVHISDLEMQRMWKVVLQHFVYKTKDILDVETTIADTTKGDNSVININKLILEAVNSKIFADLILYDKIEKNESNKFKVEKMTRYLETHSYAHGDNPNNLKIKSCIKLVFEQLLKNICQYKNDIAELDNIKAHLITLCDVSDERCITGQMEIAMYSYTVCCVKADTFDISSDIPVINKSISDFTLTDTKTLSIYSNLIEYIKKQIAAIKEERFVSAVMESNEQNVHDVCKWRQVFTNKIGIENDLTDPSILTRRYEIQIKTGTKISNFLKFFSVDSVALEISSNINKKQEKIREITNLLIDFVKNDKKRQKDEQSNTSSEYIYNQVVTEYFLFDYNKENNCKEVTGITVKGMIKIFAYLGYIRE